MIRNLDFIRDFPRRGEALDMTKAIAAFLMVLDHVNLLFWDTLLPFWLAGRVVFPLFCFAVAIHVLRGVNVKEYIKKLLPFALIATLPHLWVLWDPVFHGQWQNVMLNVIFTLGIGGIVASYLLHKDLVIKLIVLAVAFVASFYLRIVEFGPIGVLLPLGFAMLINRQQGGVVFTVICLFFINYNFEGSGISFEGLLLGFFVFMCMVLLLVFILLKSGELKNENRLLPRYFLHIFYPLHLMVLGVLVVIFGT